MGKFLKKIFLFSVFSILLIVSAFIAISFSPNFVYRTNIKTTTGGYGAALLRYREAQTFGEVDLVFLGSSHCYRGFDTRIFKNSGISSFNLGSSAQTPLNSFYLLKKHYPYLKPKKIILEVYWSTLENKGIESSIDIISNSDLDYNIFKMAFRTPTIAPKLSYLYHKIHRKKYPLINEHLFPSELDSYISGGFVQTVRRNKSNSNNLINKKPITKFVQLNYIDSINQFCVNNQIELLLICSPIYKEVIKSIPNYTEKMELLNKFSAKRNLRFINFNDEGLSSEILWIRKKDWYDDTHLTQSGVNKFNNQLLVQLANNKSK